ncbi:hypothetical protein [Pseudoduganella umbonata]|uniref:Uncharacterized protein n=1 Tax=Pseudoduganella umbonata TaxID=864828 RepID=A0A4P8HRV6_9BURK|nr:hypothetical protein [Pseudoduganella umbonata]MBB3222351.1 hypothetical protein [Pseudoduganella umbonata]QCP12567.1 hypothetical protein FCL38_20635 [Pseudoduganella umbonata]
MIDNVVTGENKMKNNAAVRQQPAAEPPSNHSDRIAPCDPAAQQQSGEAASPGAPERTVVRELHRMFALLAIR